MLVPRRRPPLHTRTLPIHGRLLGIVVMRIIVAPPLPRLVRLRGVCVVRGVGVVGGGTVCIVAGIAVDGLVLVVEGERACAEAAVDLFCLLGGGVGAAG